METAWLNRLTGQPFPKPETIPFLGLWCSRDRAPWVGTQQDLEQPNPASEPSDTLRQSLTNLANTIRSLNGKDLSRWLALVPLDPTITSEVSLSDCERALIQSLPHIEALSHSPRSHLTVEEVREQISRVRRVSHRSIAALAAHSEDWQARTFLGVRPKRILAESRQDQWDIYENRAVSTLRKRILGLLYPRLQWLNHVLRILDETSEHSNAIRGTHFRRRRLFRIWGEIFETHPSRELLARLISDLEMARARLLALADTHLFKQMPHAAAVDSPLHATNIFQSDLNYRRAFDLWHRWEQVSTAKPPTAGERAQSRRKSIEDWDLFVVLLVIRACQQLGLAPTEEASQRITFGKDLSLRDDWSLALQSDRSLILKNSGKSLLQFAGIYCSLGAQSDTQIDAALQLLERPHDTPPLVLVTVHDPESPVAPHSSEFAQRLQRLRTTTLFSKGIIIAEVSPLRIDSTEIIARPICWIAAEHEWPRLPIRKATNDWEKAWPELSSKHGILVEGKEFRFNNPPPPFLIKEAAKRAEQANLDHARKGILSKVHSCLLEVSREFSILAECPCCHSTSLGRQVDTLIMTCNECRTQFGRRICASCHKDYAFIVPHATEVSAIAGGISPLQLFGADMCALLAISERHGSEWRATHCTHCEAVSGA